MSIWLKSLLIWLLLAVIAIAAGIGRQLLLMPLLSELAARWIGTLFVCLLFFLVIWLAMRKSGIGAGTAFAIGILWVVLTIAFEFGFGHYVMGHPFERLIADYDFTAGRPWVLVLVTLLIAPVLSVKKSS